MSLSPKILGIVNNRRITEHSAMICNIPSTQTIYSVVEAFQEACGQIVGVGAMHNIQKDPTLKCIRASFATQDSLQIALNLSGTLWGGSKLLIRKYNRPNHDKTNSNLLSAQNGIKNMSIKDIQQQQTSAAQINNDAISGGINGGQSSNKTVAQQIFEHLDMQQLAYLMLVQQYITQNNQFKEQEETQKKRIKQWLKEKQKNEKNEEKKD